MAGRKPKPTHLKIVQGNPGKRGLNRKEPHAEAGIPPAPSWLSDKAKSAWDEVAPLLQAMGVLTVADGMALQGLCEAHADWLAAGKELATHGLTYMTGQGLIKANPAVSMKSDADKRRRAWLSEFGLTPSARAKLIGTKDDTPPDPWDNF